MSSPLVITNLPLPLETIEAKPLFWRHFRNRWYIYLIGMSAVVVTNVTEVLMPKCIQWIIDLLSHQSLPQFLQTDSLEQNFERIFLVLVVVWIVQGLSRRYWRLTLGRETHYVESSLRSAVWERARFFPMARLQTDLSVGVLMNVAAGDTRIARAVFGWVLVGLTDIFFLSLFTVGAMVLISPKLTLLSVFLFPLLGYLLKHLQRREYELHEKAQGALSSFNDLCSQAVATIKLQRITHTGAIWVSRLAESADAYRGKRFAVVRVALRFFITMGCAPLFAYGIIFLFGYHLVLSGEISVGEFIALQSYILILQGPLAEAGFVLGDWQRGMSSLARICEVYRTGLGKGLVADENQLTVVTPTRLAPLLSFKKVSFSYGAREILKEVSFDLFAGEKLGISGPIGAGKSTLLSIAAGLELNYRGKVSLCGHDITQYSHLALRNFIGIVPQKPFLFADTVRNNLALKLPLTDAETWHYLEVAGLADEVRRFPQQLDTKLGEWGINLSGGQKQRLTLARTLAMRPKLLLLDDCLSAVDTVTEEKILSNLSRELPEITIIWSAHRPSTLRLCKRIIDLTV